MPFSEEDTTSAAAFMDRLESIVNADFSEDKEEGEGNEKEEQEENSEKKEGKEKKKKRRNRRKAGEISGRQMAVKKYDKEETKGVRTPLVIPFIPTVESMRKVLLEFAKEEEDKFSKDEASARRI